MYKILFVDDESNILNGIKRSFRAMKNEWQMSFSTTGDEAIAILSEDTFDVIVSDIRMPGMDGVQLLKIVKDRFPRVVRLALSGYAETEMELECAKAAHQFLAKPADTETIKKAIDRSLALRILLKEEYLQSALGSIDALPSLPDLYNRILEEISSPEGSISGVATIIGQDLAMSTKVLQLVNSAFFGISTEIDTIEKAAGLLGFDVIKALVLSTKVFSSFDDSIDGGFDLEKLVRQGHQVGALAKQLAAHEGLTPKNRDKALMAGLLHDVGQLILANQFPDRYANVNRAVSEQGLSHREAEIEEFGVSHDLVGGYLLSIWGLPDSIVESVVFHHMPADSTSSDCSVLTCVYLAQLLVVAQEKGWDDDETAEQWDSKYLNRALPKANPSEWFRLARNQEDQEEVEN